MHIVPLILIILILILILILCIRQPVISLRTDHTNWSGRSPRPELEIPDEEERLLSRDEGQAAPPGQDDQPRRTRDHTSDLLTAELDYWKHVNARKAEEIEIAHEDIEKLQRELFTSVSQKAELQRRCETLLRDLEGARLFLTTADTFADSEIIQMLQKLNAELQHTATFMADRVISVFKLDGMTSDPVQQVVVNRASESIGSTLVQFLRTAGRNDFEVPMYLQIAFQAYLTRHLCWTVSSWTLDEGHNTFINEIYQRLWETEKQAISGRALTRTHVLPTCVSEPNSFITPTIAGLSDVLLAAGCTASQSHIMSELLSMFGNKILSAVSLAGRLNEMIGGVVSGDFEVFIVRPGETFHGGIMEEDIDGSGDEVQGTKTVTKAKVILESFLDTKDE